ncbi:MAG: hypothetical protein DRP57_05710 [Spirochaetes bacterium]|nr:MAG: hypothetical protein DRP57_05710 [Spirochaetota bacterium]
MHSEKPIRKKKYLEIAEYLRRDIINGKYRVGENIPTLRKLAEIYNVNPQTANKATAYLTSVGYLKPKQGSGSVVCLPNIRSDVDRIIMLVDRSRSKLIDLESPSNYHCKDLYLSFLMRMSNHKNRPGFIVYDKTALKVEESFKEAAKSILGVIVQGSLPDCYLNYMSQNNITVVLLNRKINGKVGGRFGSVIISIKTIGQMIDYLISLGHHKIIFAYSLELEESEILNKRYNAAKAAVEQWKGDLATDIKLFKYLPDSMDSLDALKSLVSKGFTAAFGYNDVSALGMYSLVHLAKMRIPLDFSVAGFDDIFASRIATPPLTTIRVNRPGMVERALKILNTIHDRTAPVYIEEEIETELVIRKSVYINNPK